MAERQIYVQFRGASREYGKFPAVSIPVRQRKEIMAKYYKAGHTVVWSTTRTTREMEEFQKRRAEQITRGEITPAEVREVPEVTPVGVTPTREITPTVLTPQQLAAMKVVAETKPTPTMGVTISGIPEPSRVPVKPIEIKELIVPTYKEFAKPLPEYEYRPETGVFIPKEAIIEEPKYGFWEKAVFEDKVPAVTLIPGFGVGAGHVVRLRQQAYQTQQRMLRETEAEARKLGYESSEIRAGLGTKELSQVREEHPEWTFERVSEGIKYEPKEYPQYDFTQPKVQTYAYLKKIKETKGLAPAITAGVLMVGARFMKEAVTFAPVGFGVGLVSKVPKVVKIEKVVGAGLLGMLGYQAVTEPYSIIESSPEIFGGIVGYGVGRRLGAGETIISPYDKLELKNIPPEFHKEYLAYMKTIKALKESGRPIENIKWDRIESVKGNKPAQEAIKEVLLKNKDITVGGTVALEAGGVKLIRPPQDFDLYTPKNLIRSKFDMFQQALRKRNVNFEYRAGRIFINGKEAVTIHPNKQLAGNIATVKSKFKPTSVYLYDTPEGVRILDPTLVSFRKIKGGFESGGKRIWKMVYDKYVTEGKTPTEATRLADIETYYGAFGRYSKDIPAGVLSLREFLVQEVAKAPEYPLFFKQYKEYKMGMGTEWLKPYFPKAKEARAIPVPSFYKGKEPTIITGVEYMKWGMGKKGAVSLGFEKVKRVKRVKPTEYIIGKYKPTPYRYMGVTDITYPAIAYKPPKKIIKPIIYEPPYKKPKEPTPYLPVIIPKDEVPYKPPKAKPVTYPLIKKPPVTIYPPYKPPKAPPVIYPIYKPEPYKPYVPPPPPIMEKIEPSRLKKVLEKVRGLPAFETWIKKEGKWKRISERPLPRHKAVKLGEEFVGKLSLSAQFKIIPKGITKEVSVPYGPSTLEFRGYKIRAGKKLPMKDQWIELKEKRLEPRWKSSEVGLIQKARGSFFGSPTKSKSTKKKMRGMKWI